MVARYFLLEDHRSSHPGGLFLASRIVDAMLVREVPRMAQIIGREHTMDFTMQLSETVTSIAQLC
jgi:hypothetical protein